MVQLGCLVGLLWLQLLGDYSIMPVLSECCIMFVIMNQLLSLCLIFFVAIVLFCRSLNVLLTNPIWVLVTRMQVLSDTFIFFLDYFHDYSLSNINLVVFHLIFFFSVLWIRSLTVRDIIYIKLISVYRNVNFNLLSYFSLLKIFMNKFL